MGAASERANPCERAGDTRAGGSPARHTAPTRLATARMRTRESVKALEHIRAALERGREASWSPQSAEQLLSSRSLLYLDESARTLRGLVETMRKNVYQPSNERRAADGRLSSSSTTSPIWSRRPTPARAAGENVSTECTLLEHALVTRRTNLTTRT